MSESSIIGSLVADRYLIRGLLGEGAMGAVYKAEHVHMKKLVALKILHSSMTDNSEVVARFEREAVAAGRLQHPGIVAATDFGSLPDDSFYIALELVEGQSLDEVLDEVVVFTAARALNVALQVTDALCAAHAEGIIHRDMKPENIMLVHTTDAEDFVKVLDFGIAKMRIEGEAEEGLTRAGLVFGTPEYMSPEQAQGKEADARSDLYGVGMILYVMLAGESPFVEDDVTAMLTAQIIHPPPELPVEIPGGLKKIVYRLLAKDPLDRHQTAEELSLELSQLAQLMAWPLPIPRTSAGTRLEIGRHQDVGIRIVDAPTSVVVGAFQSVRSFSMIPVSIGSKKIPLWIPALALAGGVAFGVIAMLAHSDVRSQQLADPGGIANRPDAETLVLKAARAGDRNAVKQLRQLVELKEEPSKGKGATPESIAGDITVKTKRYMALGRGYSALQLYSASIEMYREALRLEADLASNAELLVDVRAALGARDAVDGALDFAGGELGPVGADLIYDVYLDHLGEPGKTPVVARAMKFVKGEEFLNQASPALSVALKLLDARSCAEHLALIAKAAQFADDRSLQKLRALRTHRGCGARGNRDCYACLRGDEVALDAAVKRAETHASPSFRVSSVQANTPSP